MCLGGDDDSLLLFVLPAARRKYLRGFSKVQNFKLVVVASEFWLRRHRARDSNLTRQGPTLTMDNNSDDMRTTTMGTEVVPPVVFDANITLTG